MNEEWKDTFIAVDNKEDTNLEDTAAALAKDATLQDVDKNANLEDTLTVLYNKDATLEDAEEGKMDGG